MRDGSPDDSSSVAKPASGCGKLFLGLLLGAVRCAKILDQGIRDKHHEDREATTIQQ